MVLDSARGETELSAGENVAIIGILRTSIVVVKGSENCVSATKGAALRNALNTATSDVKMPPPKVNTSPVIQLIVIPYLWMG